MPKQPIFRWSVSLGRWRSTTARVHVSLLLALGLTLALLGVDQLLLALATIAIWCVSIALHDLAHAISAWRLGGNVDALVVGPTGGLHPPHVPDEPEPQVFVALAGPIVHLSLVVGATGALVYYSATDVLPLLNSVMPAGLFAAGEPLGLAALKIALWLNWMLFLLNLLPAYPFDGAPAMRALLWPLVGRRSSYVITSRIALAVSGVLILFSSYAFSMLAVPPYVWGSLLLLGVYLAFAAHRDRMVFEAIEADIEAEAYWLLDEGDQEDAWMRDESGHMVLVEQHYDQLKERYERQRKAQEDYEDARVDDILARLYHDGIDHLSEEDQAFLERASRRYRHRRRDKEVPGT